MNYSCMDVDQIKTGIKRLAHVLSELKARL